MTFCLNFNFTGEEEEKEEDDTSSVHTKCVQLKYINKVLLLTFCFNIML